MSRAAVPPATVIVNAIADIVGAEPCARATVRVLDRLHEAGWGFARHESLAAAAAFARTLIVQFGVDPVETVVTVRARDHEVLQVTMAEWLAGLDESDGGTDPRLPERSA